MPIQILLTRRFSEEKNHNVANNLSSMSIQYLAHCWSSMASDWKKITEGTTVCGRYRVDLGQPSASLFWLWRRGACRELTTRTCGLSVEEGIVGSLQWLLLVVNWPEECLTNFIPCLMHTPQGRRQAVLPLTLALLGLVSLVARQKADWWFVTCCKVETGRVCRLSWYPVWFWWSQPRPMQS